MNERVLRLEEVQAITGLSRSSIYRMIGRETFPSQIKLGVRSCGWLKSEVDEWLSRRIEKARPGYLHTEEIAQ